MKKLIFLPLSILCIGFLSCNNEGTQSAAAKKNLEAMHGVQKAFDTRDFSKLGDYIAEDAVDHAGESGDIKGLAALKAEYEKMTSAMTDTKSEVIKELADDEYVMSWMRFSGTMKVDMMGYKAGDKYDMKAIELAKFKDGKAIEHWTFLEPKDMMATMAKMQSQAPMPAPADSITIDTVKKK
jgi:predicted ester cyclase